MNLSQNWIICKFSLHIPSWSQNNLYLVCPCLTKWLEWKFRYSAIILFAGFSFSELQHFPFVLKHFILN